MTTTPRTIADAVNPLFQTLEILNFQKELGISGAIDYIEAELKKIQAWEKSTMVVPQSRGYLGIDVNHLFIGGITTYKQLVKNKDLCREIWNTSPALSANFEQSDLNFKNLHPDHRDNLMVAAVKLYGSDEENTWYIPVIPALSQVIISKLYSFNKDLIDRNSAKKKLEEDKKRKDRYKRYLELKKEFEDISSETPLPIKP